MSQTSYIKILINTLPFTVIIGHGQTVIRCNLLLLSKPNKTPAIHFQQLVTSFQSTILYHSTSHMRHSHHTVYKPATENYHRCYCLQYLSPETQSSKTCYHIQMTYAREIRTHFMSIYYMILYNVTGVKIPYPKARNISHTYSL